MIERLEREVAIFNAARQLPAAEQAAYLDSACADDSALRQHVEELLRAGEEAGRESQRTAQIFSPTAQIM